MEHVHIICMEYVCIYNLGHSIDLISHPRVKWLLSPKVVHNRMLCLRHQHHHLVVETPAFMYVHIICMEYVCIYNLGHSIDLISHPIE